MTDFLIKLLLYLLCGVFSISFACIVICIKERYENYITMRAQDRIGWWVIEKSDNLLDYIRKKVIEKGIDAKYLITDEFEKKVALEIIEIFQERHKELYLNCSSNTKLARMKYSDVFVYYFEKFLDEHNDNYFNGNRMYIEKSREGCKVEYNLTQYGVVYNKLRYIARFYCEKSTKLNKDNDYYSEGVKNVLDTGENTFYYHHL